ncbi:MAG: hypothetical protein KAU01_11870 [Candidatus Cloacimonetes bacterium]|nr:hypothetical protein [Candidatus Cloacimonadota bacterium]
MKTYEFIHCPNCDKTLRIPHTDETLQITCPICGKAFLYNVQQKTLKNKSKKHSKFSIIWILFIIIIIIAIIIWINQVESPTIAKRKKSKSNWVTISYNELIDRSIITHSGETVDQIIHKIPTYTDDIKGYVQPYLESYSILCHDVLLSTTEPDTLPLVNILTHYPVGSEQPVWVDLFREGHFQLYYNTHLIRVFLKGTDAEKSYNKYHSIIRHPIRDVINSSDISVIAIEVYVFNNDYADMEIILNTVPYIISKSELDLSPRHKPLDLSSISDFLNEGVILEAIELDKKNNLYFYGRKSPKQTLAGKPVSISDLAVVYRSIFHYGNNAPYISLDKHEDNRYAKVNFGGHLENTHVGHVVLEADKLFKTLSTGIDPNTHKLVKSHITKHVPGFLTEDERHLLENSDEKHMQIRYWFYPDSIGTVTDGSIGAVLTYQFLADVERMDIKINVDNAVRETIKHLNNNFSKYEKANKTYKELSTVGRMMALINWLKGMNMDERIELDDLLSVKIPGFTTPLKTKKMLAVTAITYSGNLYLSKDNVKKYTKVYYLSHLLNNQSPTATDYSLLELGKNFLSNIDISENAPSEYKKLNTTIDYYDNMIKSNESKLKSLEREIERKKYSLDRYSSREIDKYNKLINRYNSLVEKQKSYTNMYNSKINEMSKINIISGGYYSIGGGINLHPSEFKRISRNRNSPKIRDIMDLKSKMKIVGKITKSGNWIRSNPDIGKSRINKLLVESWSSSTYKNGKIKYNHQSVNGDVASVVIASDTGDWQSKISVNGSNDVVRFSKSENLLYVSHEGYAVSLYGRLSPDRKRVVFSLYNH